MFQFGNNIGSKKGSLVLSLFASVALATTIVATHSVVQSFVNDKGDCELTRIDDAQTTPTKKSWCDNPYVSSTVTGRTERPNVPITTAHSLKEIVFPAASQSNVPLPVSEAMPVSEVML